jgi:putative membrane protein
MTILFVSGLLAAALHFMFFVFESLAWGWARHVVFRLGKGPCEEDPSALRRESAALRTFAFNMGFYNLFLCVGALAGLKMLWYGCPGGKTLLTFVCLSMIGAGLVLLVSRRKPVGPLLQAGPPALCLWSLWR